MATLVQSAQSANNSASLAFGSNVTAGNLLVVVAGIANGVLTISHTVSDTLSNTWTYVGFSRDETFSSPNVGIFIATANGSGACTVTIGGTGFGSNASQVIVAEFSGTYTLVVDSASVGLQSVWRSRANDIILTASYYTGATGCSVTAPEVIIQNTSNADRSMVLAWEQPAATGSYTSSLVIGGTTPGSLTIALRPTSGNNGSYIRQAASTGESITTSNFLPTKVATGSLLLAVWGIANNNLGSFLSVADTLGSSWSNGVKFDGGNGVSIQYATMGSSGFNKVSGGTGGSACQIILIEIADHNITSVVDSDGGTTPQAVTLSASNLVFTASYYTGNTAASISSGSETLLRNQLFADRSISVAYRIHPSSGSFTSALTGGSSPAFVTIAFLDLSGILPLTPADSMNTLADAVSLAITGAANRLLTFGDNLNYWSDGFSYVGGDPDFNLQFGDSMHQSDSSRIVEGLLTMFLDTVNNWADSVATMVGIPVAVFDSNQFNWADALSLQLLAPLTVNKSDTLTFSDAVVVAMGNVVISLTAADTMNFMSDAIRLFNRLRLEFGDNFVLSDSLKIRFTHLLRAADIIITLADAVHINFPSYPAFADDMNNFSDAVSVALSVLVTRTAADTLAMSDSVSVQLDTPYNPATDILRIRRYLNDTE